MRPLIIIQARTESSRLPSKALLPVGEYAAAALAALRAGNSGLDCIVATSSQPSDDILAQVVTHHGIRVVRGPLEDVLARYAAAVANLSDESLVVRLTADNVVPDGTLLEELLAAFRETGVEYLSQDSPQSLLPYGLGGEVFSVATLRIAHAGATSEYDREHVSPWIRRNCRSAIHRPRMLEGADYSHLRCTIDDAEDYSRICRLFEGLIEPIRTPWFDLVKRLASLPDEPRFRVPYRVIAGRVHSEFTLGTAQLGMKYGITNRIGQPPRGAAVKMVRHAVAHGVTAIDTARSYGDAEQVLGDALAGAWRSRAEVVTKLDPLAALAPDVGAAAVRAEVDASLQRSSQALGTLKFATFLLHRAHHHQAWGGAAWQRLLQLRSEGKIASLGSSVYEPGEALKLLRDPAIKHLQIPMNVLDWRWRAAGIDQAFAERPDVVVHARSALLQGLLAGPEEVWAWFGSYDTTHCVREIRRLALDFGRESPLDLCLAYVRSQPWIHSVVVGCENQDQLEENLRLFCLPRLSGDQCTEIERSLPRAPEALLNPSRWKIAHASITR